MKGIGSNFPCWFLIECLISTATSEASNILIKNNIYISKSQLLTTNQFVAFLDEKQYTSLKRSNTFNLTKLDNIIFEGSSKLASEEAETQENNIQSLIPLVMFENNKQQFQKIENKLYIKMEQTTKKSEPELLFNNRYTSGFLQSGSYNNEYQEDYSFYGTYRGMRERGYTGINQIVTIVDSGVNSNNTFFQDIIEDQKYSLNHRKIVKYDVGSNYEQKDRTGHGTHIAGTIAGKSNHDKSPASAYNGIAPDAKLYVVGIDTSSSSYNLADTITQMKKFDSSISVQGWGHKTMRFQDKTIDHSLAVKYDKASYENPELLFIFPIGNSKDVLTPSDAKNVLCVGPITSIPADRNENEPEICITNQDNENYYVSDKWAKPSKLFSTQPKIFDTELVNFSDSDPDGKILLINESDQIKETDYQNCKMIFSISLDRKSVV